MPCFKLTEGIKLQLTIGQPFIHCGICIAYITLLQQLLATLCIDHVVCQLLSDVYEQVRQNRTDEVLHLLLNDRNVVLAFNQIL